MTSSTFCIGGEHSVRRLGFGAEALRPYPDGLLIATKVGVAPPNPDEATTNGRPDFLRQQVEQALRRLRVERLELLQLHRIDPTVPLADQLGALRQLQVDGKIGHIGLSRWHPTTLALRLGTLTLTVRPC